MPRLTVGGHLHARGTSTADLLAFEAQWWRYLGAKEQAIRDAFDVTPTRYYQLLNAAIDSREALEVGPMTTRRLRRIREARQQGRAGFRV